METIETITEQTIPVRSDDIVHFPSGDQTYLHHLINAEYFALNVVGSRVWELCGGELDIAGIAERLTHDFDVERDDAVRDVIDLVGLLYREDCIQLR